MEFMIQWWWLVHLAILALALYTAYKAIVTHKFKSKLWNALAVITLILMVVAPVKLVPTTDTVNTIQSTAIEEAKILPPLVSDNSFKKSTNVQSITKEDLK